MGLYLIFEMLLLINEQLLRFKNFYDTGFLWGCQIKVNHSVAVLYFEAYRTHHYPVAIWFNSLGKTAHSKWTTLLVNSPTETNQKWRAA